MSNQGKSAKARLLPHLVVFGAYSVLTIALTYPLFLRLNSHIAGNDIDVWLAQWGNWWLEKAVAEGTYPYHTRHLFYPQGVSLVFHSFSPLNTFLWWLLKRLFEARVSYNLTILLAYVASGYTMWLFARYWTGNDYASFVAGAIFAFSPYHMVESAHPNIVATQWIPLSSLYLVRALRERKVGYACLSAVFLAFSAWSGWHLFLLAGLWMLLYLAYEGLFQRKLGKPGSIRCLLVFAVLSLVLLAPLIYPVVQEQLQSGISYLTVPMNAGQGNHPWAFIIPSRHHPVLDTMFGQANQAIGISSRRPGFVGYIVLLMSLHAALRGGRQTHLWTLAVLVFTLLSLGPEIPLRTGEVLEIPWAAPVVALLRHPFRFNILISCCLSMLVACDVAQLLQTGLLQWKIKRWHLLFTILLTALILFEYLSLPFPTMDPEVSHFYHLLEKSKEDYAIVEVPIGRQPDKTSMYYQTIHGKRLVGGMVARTPRDAYSYIRDNAFLWAAYTEDPTVPPQSRVAESLEKLADDDVRYVVLKKRWMKDPILETWRSVLRGGEIYEDDELVVYTTADLPEK